MGLDNLYKSFKILIVYPTIIFAIGAGMFDLKCTFDTKKALQAVSDAMPEKVEIKPKNIETPKPKEETTEEKVKAAKAKLSLTLKKADEFLNKINQEKLVHIRGEGDLPEGEAKKFMEK